MSKMHPNRKQRGFSLIMAIFLVVVLGGIAVFIGRVTSLQIQGSTLDEESAMAYQAARAGIEWGVYQAIVGMGCSSITFPLTLSTAVGTVTYTVTETCSRVLAGEGSTLVYVFQITATANNAAAPGGNYYVERQLSATVSK